MSRTVTVSLLPDRRISVALDQHTLTLDRPPSKGGQGNDPSPTDLFLMSIAACSTFYAMSFAEQRGLGTEGLALSMECEYDEKAHRYPRMDITLTLPQGFPEKYENAVTKAMEACTVKKHIANPPVFTQVAKRS